MLGALYACIAAGFSLVWGVLNVINMLHGSLIVLGGYVAYYASTLVGINPFLTLPAAAAALFVVGYLLQRGVINRVVGAPVLTTLTLTFGLNLIVSNAMVVAFTATPRRVAMNLGTLEIGGIYLPLDRLAAMSFAFLLTGLLYWVLRTSRVGRAIVAVRMDRDAAALMGIRVERIYAVTFALGAMMAGAAGCVLSIIFPVAPTAAVNFISVAFVVCVIGGLGSVPGALVGGLALGVSESMASMVFGPQYAVSTGFALMLVLLLVKPTGLLGKKGYE